jgi:hypothetical protein
MGARAARATMLTVLAGIFFSTALGSSSHCLTPGAYGYDTGGVCLLCIRGSSSSAESRILSPYGACATCDEVLCNGTFADAFVQTQAGNGAWGYLDGAAGADTRFRQLFALLADPLARGILVADEARVRLVGYDGAVSSLAQTAQGASLFLQVNSLSVGANSSILYVLDNGETVYTADLAAAGGKTYLPGFPLAASTPPSCAKPLLAIAVNASSGTLFWITQAGFVCALPPSGPAVAQVVAGGGGGGGSVDGRGTAAGFGATKSLTFAPDGALLVADRTSLRRLDGAAVVSTLAGSLTLSGHVDGPALATARLDGPMAVATAGSIVYFVEAKWVRRLEGGVVTTLAGTGSPYAELMDAPAGRASFGRLVGVAVDPLRGTVWVADYETFSVRALVGGACALRSVAGGVAPGYLDRTGAAARFHGPAHLAVNPISGLLYVADERNHRLRSLDPGTGAVATLSGSGAYGVADGAATAASFMAPFGVATDATGATLFVSDAGAHTIRAVVIATTGAAPGFTSTLCGSASTSGFADAQGSAAKLSQPRGLAYTSVPAATLYVADTGNFRVRAVDVSTGLVSTLVGSGTQRTGNDVPPTLVLSANLKSPRAVAVDAAGVVFVADDDLLLNVSGGNVATFAGGKAGGWRSDGVGTSGVGFFEITALWMAGDKLYAAHAGSLGASGVVRVVSTGTREVRTLLGGAPADFQMDASGDATSLNPVGGLAASATGALYFTQLNAIHAWGCDTACPAGHYCPSQYRPTPCPATRYGARPGLVTRACTGACPAGFYCPEGTSAPVPCPLGHFCPPEAAAPTPCAAGSYATAQARRCLLCPPGTFEPRAGASACHEVCPPGTFGKAYGGLAQDGACAACAPGKYTSAEGATACTSCDAGTFGAAAGAAAASSCAACPPGRFSWAGAAVCSACPVGRFAPLAGAPECLPCPAGRFLNAQSATSEAQCEACPQGSYGPAAGAASSGCIFCPAGTASPALGATDAATCAACAPGAIAPQPGAAACDACGAGTFSGAGGKACTPCPLGSLSAAVGATSAAACALCPAGKTTLAAGASMPSQCVELVTSCGAGSQPGPPGAAPCVPLVCPLPLLSAPTGAAASSTACAGCAAGRYGAPPAACAPCPAGSVCPGLAAAPLFNFSQIGAAGAPPLSCALGAPVTPLLAADGGGGGGSARSPLAANGAWLVLGGAVALFAAVNAASRLARRHGALHAALMRIDLLSSAHLYKAGEPVRYFPTALGGLISALTVLVIAAYSAFLVQNFLSDANALTQQALLPREEGWADRLPPWAAAAAPWAPAGAPLSELQVRVFVSGNPGDCGAPLAWAAAGGGAQRWALRSAACSGGGDASVAQHVFSCAGCVLDERSALSAAFNFSCQSLLLEALAVPAAPAPAPLAAVRAAPALTVAPPGARLAALAWTLHPALSLLRDSTASPPLERAGYALSLQQLRATSAPLGAAAGGLPTLQPASAALQLTVELPLQLFIAKTTTVPLTSASTLVANLVGLAGLLAFAGTLKKGIEGAREVLREAGAKWHVWRSGKRLTAPPPQQQQQQPPSAPDKANKLETAAVVGVQD